MALVAADLVVRLRGGDELLAPNVNEEIVQKAIDWLTFFANKLGVNADSIKVNFIVAKLLQAYAYREVCVSKSFSIGSPFKGGEDAPDYYGKKLYYYESRIKELEKSITPLDLTRGDAGVAEERPFKPYRSVSIKRG